MKQENQKQIKKVLIYANIALLSLLLAVAIFMALFACVEGRLFLRGSRRMDLRGKALTNQEFDAIAQEYPGYSITWDVPFRGSTLSSDTQELTLDSLSDEEVTQLRYLTELSYVDGSNCPDYLQLYRLGQEHPQCRMVYNVPICGESYPQDTTALILKDPELQDVQALSALPWLEQVQISGFMDYPLLLQLQQENPQWNLTYSVRLGEEEFLWTEHSVSARDASYDQIAAALAGMPQLKELKLVNPRAEGQKLVDLQTQYAQTQLDWEVEFHGQVFPRDTKEMDISGIVVNSCEEVEELAASLPDLEKLIMSDCGIDNETMAEFRERQRPNYKVVWTVYLSDKTKARTDELYFMPIQQGEYYFMDEDTPNLKYCEDMICLDLGHHMIRNIDFVAYMPNLKYLILAHGGVRDISPIVHCQELVYLEVDWSEIQDYTPIAQLKKLEDLNLERTYCDITPLLEMTWLKNLWVPGRSYATRQLLTEALPNTRLVFGPTPEGQGWRNLPNYYAMRDVLGMYYMR